MSYSRRSRYASHSRSPYERRRSLSRSPSRYRSRSRSGDSSDVENPGNNLYVTGLSSRITKTELEKHFSSEGKVTDVHLVMDPWTRESRGFGFVTMANVEDADRCIKYLDGSVLEGRVITVEKAKRRCGRTPTPGRYLGARTLSERRRSPSYSPFYYRSRYSSPGYSSGRDRSYSPYYRCHRSRSYSPHYRLHRSRSYSPYYRRHRSRSYSPYYRRNRSRSWSTSPYSRRRSYYSDSRSYSPPYNHRCNYHSISSSLSPRQSASPIARSSRRDYSPSVSPRAQRVKRNYSRSVSPDEARRSYSRGVSPPGVRRTSRRYERSYSPKERVSKRSPYYSPSVSSRGLRQEKILQRKLCP